MKSNKKEQNDKTLRLIYNELPVLLQQIICSAQESVGYDGLDVDFEYVKKYADETMKVANLCIDGQLATLEKIIKETAQEVLVQEQSISSNLKANITINGLDVLKNISSCSSLGIETICTDKTKVEVNLFES